MIYTSTYLVALSRSAAMDSAYGSSVEWADNYLSEKLGEAREIAPRSRAPRTIS